MALEVKETSTKLGSGGPYTTSFPLVGKALALKPFASAPASRPANNRVKEKRLGGGGGSKRFARTPAKRVIL